MWNYGYNEEAMVNLRDSVLGIVKGQNRSGLYIDLNIENDFDDCKESIPAFGYWGGRLPIGTKVMCSIRKPASVTSVSPRPSQKAKATPMGRPVVERARQ